MVQVKKTAVWVHHPTHVAGHVADAVPRVVPLVESSRPTLGIGLIGLSLGINPAQGSSMTEGSLRGGDAIGAL